MTDALKPCPFCGSAGVSLDAKEGFGVNAFCHDCCAEGPWIELFEDDPQVSEDVRQEATNLWNKREA